VLDWPGLARDDAVALRFCGALHALVQTGVSPELAAVYPPEMASESDLRDAIARTIVLHEQAVLASLDSAPQTNEVARSGMLLPGFLAIARQTQLPLAICEIGSSAGLNLLFDRFHYQYGDTAWGDPASPLRLAPEVRAAMPRLDGTLSVIGRSGCDISPVDVADPQARLRLRSYVWPDQALRVARMEAAIGLAQAARISVERIDALRFVRERLMAPQPGVTRTLFHSIMWQYMPENVRGEIELAMAEIGTATGADSPVAWLRMEPLDTLQPFATMTMTMWPGGEMRTLAKCDYHGRWIEWVGGVGA